MRTDGDRYAEYDVRVYDDGEQDATATGLQRALHAELCRDRPHGDSPWPACWRAEQVVRKWERNVAEAVDTELDPLRAFFLTGIMKTRRAIAAQEALGGVPAAAPELDQWHDAEASDV